PLLRRGRRMPHGVPVSGDAAPLHGDQARGRGAGDRHHGADSRDSGELPVGPLPAQSRRVDARDGERGGARLHVDGVRDRPAHEAQPRHPPPPRAAPRQRARRDRADDGDPVLAARQPRPLLRRRDRDGRQHLPRRPRRRPHADAVDRRPERRLQPRGFRAALPSPVDGSRFRVPGGERGGTAQDADVASPLGAPVHRAPAGASAVQPRELRAASPGEPARARPHPSLRGRHRALCPQPLADGAGGRARPVAVRGDDPAGDGRRHALPADRRAAVPAHVRPARVLLVPAQERPVSLVEYVHEQRWFGGKSLEVTGAEIVDHGVLRHEPRLADALVELRYGDGNHDLYQLLLGEDDEFDVIADPSTGGELVRLIAEGAKVATADGQIAFERFAELPDVGGSESRLLGVEQSNSSLVVGDSAFLKVYRRIEAGENPDLEMTRFLVSHGYEHVPQLLGWWSYSGPLVAATLGMAQAYLPGSVDGWSLALEELVARPDEFVARVRRLGGVVGELHATLAGDSDDPAFCPEEASPESVALLAATV